MEDIFFEIKNFSQDDVLAFNAGMCRAEKMTEQLKSVLTHDLSSELSGRFNKKVGFTLMPQFNVFAEGVNCEILKVGAQSWQKGKIRLKVTLEFVPDEMEEI